MKKSLLFTIVLLISNFSNAGLISDSMAQLILQQPQVAEAVINAREDILKIDGASSNVVCARNKFYDSLMVFSTGSRFKIVVQCTSSKVQSDKTVKVSHVNVSGETDETQSKVFNIDVRVEKGFGVAP